MPGSERLVRVIKLGGSLLDWPEWPVALRSWRKTQPDRFDVLVVGGGAWADLIRQADARFNLGEEASHWLCLRLMSVTARLAAALLSEAALVERWEPLLAEHAAGSLALVDCLPLIVQAERAAQGNSLPHAWAVTSDSIAAWLAVRLRASELVLLKSALPESPLVRQAIAVGGYVDPYFPQASRELGSVRCVNLRDERFASVVLDA